MKLHLPLRLRYSILTLLAASVPCFSTSASAEDIIVNPGDKQTVTAINGGNVTLGENAILNVVDETIIRVGTGLHSQLNETQAIMETLTLANGSKVDSSGTYPIYGINLLSNTRFEIDTINLLAGASSSIVGRDIILGDIVTTEGGSSSLSITSYGNITFNAGSVSNGVQLHLKGDLSLEKGSVVTASSFTGELTIGEGTSFTVTEKIILTGTSTNNGTLALANHTNLSLGALEGTGTLVLGDGEGSADTAAKATSFTGVLDIKADASFTVEGTTSLTGGFSNAGILVTGNLALTGNVSLTGAGALTVTGNTTLNESALTVVNGSQINLGTVSGNGSLYLGDNELTNGAADTCVSISGVDSGKVWVRNDATLALANGATVGGTLEVYGNLQGSSMELADSGEIRLYNNLDAAGLSINGGGAIRLLGSGNTNESPEQIVSLDSFTASVGILQKKQTLQANSATLIGSSTLQGGTLAARNVTLADNATLSQTGKLVAEQIVLKDGSWLDWRDSGTLESAAVSAGEGDATVPAPARISMEHGSTLTFLHEIETNPENVSLFADVTGNGQVGIGYFLSPTGHETASAVNVTIEGVLQAGDTLSSKKYNGLVVWNDSTLTVGTGEWVKGKNSLELSGNSVVEGTASLNMKYGRLMLKDGASLVVAGAFNYLELGEGEADDDACRRIVHLGNGAELTLNTDSLASLKSVDGFGKLILGSAAPETFEIEGDFTGSFKLETGKNLSVAGATTLNGESTGTGGNELTTNTLTNNADASLSNVDVQASQTILGNGELTLQNAASLQLGDISGYGTLVLNNATASATSVCNPHIHVGDAATFTLIDNASGANQFSLSGSGAVVLGSNSRVSSSDIDINSLNVKDYAELNVTGKGNIASLTVGNRSYVTMEDGTGFTLGSINNQGTIVLGNGILSNGDIDTVVSMSQMQANRIVEIREDARLQLGEDITLSGSIDNCGIIEGTSATIVDGLGLTGSGKLILESLTINSLAAVTIDSNATIGYFSNDGMLDVGNGTLTNGERDAILDLSGSAQPYIIQGGQIIAREDSRLITGNNILSLSWNSSILGGLNAGEIRLEQGVLLQLDNSRDLVADKVTSEKGARLWLGSNSSTYTAKAVISELQNLSLSVGKNAELEVSKLTLKGELINDGRIDGGILAYNGSASISGTGSASFTETQLGEQAANVLTVKNISDINLGKVHGGATLVLGDGVSESGFDTIVTAESMEAFNLTVNSDATLTTQFLSMEGDKCTINGRVVTDYISPASRNGILKLNAADFEKITVNKGAKLYATTYLFLENVSLSFESVEQIDTSKGWGELTLGDDKLTNGEVDTSLTVSGAFDAVVRVLDDAALTVENTAKLKGGSIYGSLTAGNLYLYDKADIRGAGILNITGETTLGTGAKIWLYGSQESMLGDVRGAGTLLLGDVEKNAMTSATASSFEGMLDIKSVGSLTVTGAATLQNQSSNAGTLQAGSLTLSEGAVLTNTGTITTETGVISLNTGSTLALTGSQGGVTGSVSGTGTLQVGDGDAGISTTAELTDFRGLLDIKSDGALATTTTTLISVQKDENTLVTDSYLNGSLTTQNLNIEGKVNLSGAGTLAVQTTTLAENATLNLWGSENICLGTVSGTGDSTLALGSTGATTSATAASFNCTGLQLAGDTTFTVSGDFTADEVDMGAESGATLHLQNGTTSLGEIGNATDGLQTGSLILGDGENDADTFATVGSLNLSSLEIKGDATLTKSGNGDFKTGSLAMEAGALLDFSDGGPIIELGTVTGAGRMVLGADKRASSSTFEGDLDLGAKASMSVLASYTGALNIGEGASMEVSGEHGSITTLTGDSTNLGTLSTETLELKNGATLSGNGHLVVTDISLESGTRLNLTNSARPEGSVISGFDPGTMALHSISGKGAFVMYGGTRVMADSFEGCLGMRTNSTLIVDGTARLNGIGAGYGFLAAREVVIAEKSGFETHYSNAILTSYDFDGDIEGGNPAVALTLTLEAGSYLHMYNTGMQDFLDLMTVDSITLKTGSVFYGQGNLHIDQEILDKFFCLDGKIQVSGIITYDDNVVLTGYEGMFEGGVTEPSTADVPTGDVSGDVGGDTGVEHPEAQEVNDVADEIVQEEINNPAEPDPGSDITPEISDGGISTGDVIGGIADAAVITGGAAGIVATGLKAYGKVKAAKYAAIAAGIGVAGGVITKIVLTLTEDDEDVEDDTEAVSIIEREDALRIINTDLLSGDETLLNTIIEKTRELQESGELDKLKNYEVNLYGNSEVDIKETLAAWFPEFDKLKNGKLCISSPEITITGTVILGGDDISFKGYSAKDADLENFDLMGDNLVFNKGGEARSTKVVAKDTLRLRAYDTDVREGSILAARNVDIKAKTLEVSGDSYIVSTEKAKLDISEKTEISGSTAYLQGVTDGSTVGDLVAKDGARVVLDGSSSSTIGASSVQLTDSDLSLKNMNATVFGKTEVGSGATLAVSDATYSTKSMEVSSNGALQVNKNSTISSTNGIEVNGGTVTNNGTISSGIVVNGGTVQGAGTFSAITLNGGKLLVGDSMEQMSFTGDLVLGDGDIRFSVETFETVALDSWNADVCSSVDMRGNDFIFGDDSVLEVGFCGNTKEALAAARDSATVTFSLTLVQNVGNVSFFTEEVLAAMLENTKLLLTPDASDSRAISMNGEDITGYAHNPKYSIETGNSSGTYNIVLSGNFGRVDSIPEPTTTALSLLALAGLAMRRRRK